MAFSGGMSAAAAISGSDRAPIGPISLRSRARSGAGHLHARGPASLIKGDNIRPLTSPATKLAQPSLIPAGLT